MGRLTEPDSVRMTGQPELLVRDPSQFDVIVTTNMFGDIISDKASELSGSFGLAGAINAGDDKAVGQAQHGSAPDIAGKDIANPVSSMLSGAMMLDWMSTKYQISSLADAAKQISEAIEAALNNPASRTRDLGGPLEPRLSPM